MVDVSIVILNFNTFEFLTNCIASIREHTKGVSYEIIVVDNGSTVNDILLIMQESSDLKIIKIVKNTGFSIANNKGALGAIGRYILFVNNDTLFLEDTLTILVEFCDKQKNELLVGCKILNSDFSLQDSILQSPNIRLVLFESLFLYKVFPNSKFFNSYYQNYIKIDETIEVDIVKGCFVFLKRESFNRLKGYDNDFIFYSDETDFCKRFRDEIGSVVYFPETKIIHFGGGTTGNTSWFVFKNMARSRIIYYKKWFNGIPFILIMAVQYLGYILRFFVFTLLGIVKLNMQNLRKGYFFLKMLFIYPKGNFKVQK